jgi:hypothetical protein
MICINRTAPDTSIEKIKYNSVVNWLVSQWTVTPNEINVLCKYKQWDTLLLACISAAQQHQQHQQQQQQQQQQLYSTVPAVTQSAATTHDIIVSAITDAIHASISTSSTQQLSSALGALWYVLHLHDSKAVQQAYYHTTEGSPTSTFAAMVNDIMNQYIKVAASQHNSSNNCTYGSVQDLVSQAIVTALGTSATATVDTAMTAVAHDSDNTHVQR